MKSKYADMARAEIKRIAALPKGMRLRCQMCHQVFVGPAENFWTNCYCTKCQQDVPSLAERHRISSTKPYVRGAPRAKH